MRTGVVSMRRVEASRCHVYLCRPGTSVEKGPYVPPSGEPTDKDHGQHESEHNPHIPFIEVWRGERQVEVYAAW